SHKHAGLTIEGYSRAAVQTYWRIPRSEEHTSELQSHVNLVCRLLLEKKQRCCNPQLAAWPLAFVPIPGSRLFRLSFAPPAPSPEMLAPFRNGFLTSRFFFFFNDTQPPEFSPFSLPGPLPF